MLAKRGGLAVFEYLGGGSVKRGECIFSGGGGWGFSEVNFYKILRGVGHNTLEDTMLHPPLHPNNSNVSCN